MLIFLLFHDILQKRQKIKEIKIMKITPATEKKINDIIENMSLEEKILQMFQMDNSAHKEAYPELSKLNISKKALI